MKKKIVIGLSLLLAVCGIAVAAGTCYNYYYRKGDSNGLSVTTERIASGGTKITVSSNVERRIRIISTSFGKGTQDVFEPYGSKTYKVSSNIIKSSDITVEAQTCD